MHRYELSWQHPLIVLSAIAEDYPQFCVLYSGLLTGYSGTSSWLAFDAIESIEGNDTDLLRIAIESAHEDIPTWFGHLSYEFGRSSTSATQKSPIPLPKIRLLRYRHVLHFNHVDERITVYTHDKQFDLTPYLRAQLPTPSQTLLENTLPRITSLESNMDKITYRKHVEACLDEIRAGSFYQANLTRKFIGTWKTPPSLANFLALYTRLSHISPSPYSAMLAYTDACILSSSPEMFLKIDRDGTLHTRPIKGTLSAMQHAHTLAMSEKNRAENLMIVDLMRNDLSQIAVQGSVHVPNLFEVDSFSTLHHLSSTITAQLRPECTIADAILACMPAGSMTGAPKKRVMEWCEKTEGIERGIYSGVMGWISKKECELSVVIRTLVTRKNQFEFQVGGGIVADSEPHDEWQETMTKARGLCLALGIHVEDLMKL